MQIDVSWDSRVLAKLSGLTLCVGTANGVRLEKENEQLRQLKKTVYGDVKAKHNAGTLKDNPTVRAYRDFYWRLGIDPTKIRPSGEALMRRVLHGIDLPTISTVVDAYNLASMQTLVPISGFDMDRLSLPLQVRFARNDEYLTGIGMDKPLPLTDNMLVLADAKEILCIYPYRDSDHSKITLQTREVLMVAYGAPEIAQVQLEEAVKTTLSYIRLVAGGWTGTIKVFSCTPK